MPYELIRYRPDLHEDVAALHALLLAGDSGLSSAYLQWKYAENPYIADPLLYLAVAGTRVVGMRGAYGTRWEAGDAGEFCLPCLSDTVIDPDHRDRGLFASLTAFALEDLQARGYAYALNLSATSVATLGSLAGGWRGVGRPTTLRRRSAREIAVREARLRSRRRRGSGAVPQPFARFDRATRRAGGDGLDTLLPAGVDSPARHGEGSRRVRHVRDAAYFSWRLADPRAGYRLVRAREEHGGGGYLALAGFSGERHVYVADWEAADATALQRLLRSALRQGRFGTAVLRATGLDDATETAFRRVGFTDWTEADAGVCPALLVRPTSESARGERRWLLGGRDLLDPGTWELRQLDSDLV